MLDMGCSALRANGLEDLKRSLAEVSPRRQAVAIAADYIQAKQAVILFDRSRTTAEAARLLADMAVLSGHIGKEYSGVIQLRQSSNSQGLANLGIRRKLLALEQDLAAGKIQGLLVMGQFLPEGLAAKAPFRIVLDCQASPCLLYTSSTKAFFL